VLSFPVIRAQHPRPFTLSIGGLFSAKPLRARRLRVRSSLNPLECALPRVLIHKLFRMRSSEKSGGRGYSRRSLSPKFFPCHTSENSPVSPILATDPKTYLSKSCTCHTSETPPGGLVSLSAYCRLFFRAASNSSPCTQPARVGSHAAFDPSTKPNLAMTASPLKSMSGLYSSLGW